MKTKSGPTENSKAYNHKEVESKWQKRWEKDGLYSPDITKAKKKFYNLWMFPYPSAEGLHAGHAFASTGSDIYGRFMRMNGYDVFQPIGYDSFGIHSENFAIKIGEQPQTMLARTTKHYEEQLRSMGHGYDWSRTVTTSDLDYYRWTQWLFVELFKAGLAYRKKAEVNWCPFDKTVLSDEQVTTPAQAGKVPPGYKSLNDVPQGIKVCERCGNIVEKKELEQWFFRITDYAQKLRSNLDKIKWSEGVRVTQRNWIGESKGMLISFKKENGQTIDVFTTRPDTLNGATFIALADDDLYNKYKDTDKKFGIFTKEYAINPLNGKKLPIWKTNYVASGYGTGAIMGVPAHDERDSDFAKKYKIEIIDEKPDDKLWKIIAQKGWGKAHTNYHLRDWLISRQRYWGPPIPMIYCEKCAEEGNSYFTKFKPDIRSDQSDWNPSGWYPEEKLPVELPFIKDYKPEGSGKGPLANHPEFYEVKCPHCGSKARRETDVSDTFVDSAWYFLRYPTVGSKNDSKRPFDPVITKDWLPVDLYFGGAEHAVLHLMYARFITMVLHDLKLLNFEEPFPFFYAHGLMIKDGAKMSKSRGNVVNPDQYITKFGADTLRFYLMFMGPMDGYPDFRDTGIEGMQKFTNRLWNLFKDSKKPKSKEDEQEIMVKMNQTIQKVTQDLGKFHYNTAIASLMEFVNLLKEKGTIEEALTVLARLIAPFAPHLAEEVWIEVLRNKESIHISTWPKFDSELVKEHEVTVIVQINGKVRSQVLLNSGSALIQKSTEKMALADPSIKKWLKGKKVKKIIFVPGKILNFVIS